MSKAFELLLQEIDSERARLMLEDLKNEDKRTPQLYNAIAKLLEQHKFSISKVQPDTSILGDLASALPDLDEADLYTAH